MKETNNEKTDQITQIIYTSIAAVPFSKEQLKDLLVKARKNNHSLFISGMLVYDDGFFIQVLEGPEKEVDKLFTLIEKDKRHKNMRILSRRPINKKEYAEWAMGFVDTIANQKIEGFIPYSTLRRTVQDETRAKKLIKMFQEGQWRQVVNT